jgi:hypothetical protein
MRAGFAHLESTIFDFHQQSFISFFGLLIKGLEKVFNFSLSHVFVLPVKALSRSTGEAVHQDLCMCCAESSCEQPAHIFIEENCY